MNGIRPLKDLEVLNGNFCINYLSMTFIVCNVYLIVNTTSGLCQLKSLEKNVDSEK